MDTLSSRGLVYGTWWPLAYAQLTRIVCLVFLVLLPFAANVHIRWFVMLVSFLVNVIYFTVDHCASEMETPFGDNTNDIDFDKHLRRIDKHTAALLSVYTGYPVSHFDIFPETRTTDGDHKLMRAGSYLKNVYELEKKAKEARVRRKERITAGVTEARERVSKIAARSRSMSRGKHSLAAKHSLTGEESCRKVRHGSFLSGRAGAPSAMPARTRRASTEKAILPQSRTARDGPRSVGSAMSVQWSDTLLRDDTAERGLSLRSEGKQSHSRPPAWLRDMPVTDE